MNKQRLSLTSWNLESGREADIPKTHIKYIITNYGKHFEGKGEGAMMKYNRDQFRLGDGVRKAFLRK